MATEAEVEEKEEVEAEVTDGKPAFDAEAAFGSLSEKLDQLLSKPAPRRRKPRVKIEPAPERKPDPEPEAVTTEAEAEAPEPKVREHRYGSRRWFGDRSLEPE